MRSAATEHPPALSGTVVMDMAAPPLPNSRPVNENIGLVAGRLRSQSSSTSLAWVPWMAKLERRSIAALQAFRPAFSAAAESVLKGPADLGGGVTRTPCAHAPTMAPARQIPATHFLMLMLRSLAAGLSFMTQILCLAVPAREKGHRYMSGRFLGWQG